MKEIQKELFDLEATKSTMNSHGIPIPSEVSEKIEELSIQTREKLPKWVKEPTWMEKIEAQKGALITAIEALKEVRGTKNHIASLKARLDKIEKVFDDPRDYLPGGLSRNQYAHIFCKAPETIREIRKFTPEELNTLNTLEARFNANMNRHTELNWNEIKASLGSNPEALIILSKMESAGHEPDVYNDDVNFYYFGTCSIESPESGRNLNYEESVRQANTMGITLMPREDYLKLLKTNRYFDKHSMSWLSVRTKKVSTLAPFGYRGYNGPSVDFFNAKARNPQRAWRGTLKVSK